MALDNSEDGVDLEMLDLAKDEFALHRASKDGNLSLVKDLLGEDKVKPKILKEDMDGHTVLHVASTADVLRFLLNELSDTAKEGICQPDRRGRTVLHTTVLRKDVDMLMVLVDFLEDRLEDVIFREDSQNMTVLHHAAEIGNLKAIEIFLSKLGNQAKDEILRTDKFGRTVLHRAAAGGDIEVFKETVSRLSYDYEMSETDINGDTILHTAAQKGSVSIVEFLLERLGDQGSKDAIQKKNINHRNVLRVAVYEGEKDVLGILLDKLGNEAKRVICEKDDGGDTVLHEAAIFGQLDIVEVVMTALGSQAPNIINEKNHWGETVLHVAGCDNIDIVNLILWKLGGHVRDGILEEDCIGRTFLSVAVASGNVGIFRTLMDKLGGRAKEGILKKDTRKATLLHAVVQGGNSDIFRMLMLELGTQAKDAIRHPDDKGNNPLHLAVRFGRSNMFKEIVELGGHDLLHQCNRVNATPIHIAAVDVWGSEDILKSLFQLMNIKVQEMKDILGKGRTLHLACELSNKHLVRTLLNQNTEATVEVKDIMASDELFLGNTALHAAAIGGDLDIVKQLLNVVGSSCNINKIKNWYGQTPLHFAAAGYNYKLVQYLIEEKGANPAQEDNAGVTPLHFAARSASQRVLQLISDSLGTDYNINKLTGLAGLSPLHYAAWNCNEGAIDWLVGAEGIDLEVKDKVENLAPWYWSVLGPVDYYKEYVLKTLLIAHISKEKNPFTDDIQKFLEDHPNLDGKLLDLACLETLKGVCDAKVILSPSLISCVAAYGNATTASKLADELQKVDDITFVQELLRRSRPLEFAAMRANADESRVGVTDKFLAVMEENKEFHKQLESSFNKVLQSGDKKGLEFARCLVKHMRPSQVHDLLQAELCSRITFGYSELTKTMEDKLKNLRLVDKLIVQNVQDLVHDVPLAYWMAHLHQTEQKAEVLHTSTSTEQEGVETRSKSIGHSSDSTTNIITFIKELSILRIKDSINNQTKEASKDMVGLEGYPNNVGNRTGRTALHWAVIFGDKEIVKELCGDPRCKRDVVDRFGKLPYSYATLNLSKDVDMLDYLKWDKYYESLQREREMYIDALNAILVGAALIATVTFSGVLQPPLQYTLSNRDHQKSDIKYVAINRADVQTFWVFNSLSFFFSMASALAGVIGVLPNVVIFDLALVERIRTLLVRAAAFLVISITFVLAAFTSAGFAVLPQVLKLRANMIVTTLLGGSFCVYMLGKFAKAVGEAVSALTPDSLIWRRRVDLFIRQVWSTMRNSLQNTSLWNNKVEDKIESVHSAVDQPVIKPTNKQRNSIRTHILNSGGFAPWYFDWDDGLWDEPFAQKENRIDISTE